jgi:hypothetical protein
METKIPHRTSCWTQRIFLIWVCLLKVGRTFRYALDKVYESSLSWEPQISYRSQIKMDFTDTSYRDLSFFNWFKMGIYRNNCGDLKTLHGSRQEFYRKKLWRFYLHLAGSRQGFYRKFCIWLLLRERCSCGNGPSEWTRRKTPPHCYLIVGPVLGNVPKRTDPRENAAAAQQQTYIHIFRYTNKLLILYIWKIDVCISDVSKFARGLH